MSGLKHTRRIGRPTALSLEDMMEVRRRYRSESERMKRYFFRIESIRLKVSHMTVRRAVLG